MKEINTVVLPINPEAPFDNLFRHSPLIKNPANGSNGIKEVSSVRFIFDSRNNEGYFLSDPGFVTLQHRFESYEPKLLLEQKSMYVAACVLFHKQYVVPIIQFVRHEPVRLVSTNDVA